jgi:hypothetical protein
MRTEKRKKGGRIPKLKPKTHQVMLRFDEDEWNKFITMYETCVVCFRFYCRKRGES